MCSGSESFVSRFLWLISSICAYCFQFCRSFQIVFRKCCISFRQFNTHGMSSWFDCPRWIWNGYYNDGSIVLRFTLHSVAAPKSVIKCLAIEIRRQDEHLCECVCVRVLNSTQLPQEFWSEPFTSNANTFIYSWKDSVYHNWNGHGRKSAYFLLAHSIRSTCTLIQLRAI